MKAGDATVEFRPFFVGGRFFGDLLQMIPVPTRLDGRAVGGDEQAFAVARAPLPRAKAIFVLLRTGVIAGTENPRNAVSVGNSPVRTGGLFPCPDIDKMLVLRIDAQRRIIDTHALVRRILLLFDLTALRRCCSRQERQQKQYQKEGSSHRLINVKIDNLPNYSNIR